MTGAPVIVATASATESRCWTFIVDTTWIPASRITSTSSQRLARADPGAFVWASSSTSATVGRRAMTASVSISSTVMSLYATVRRGTTSRPSTSAGRERPAVGLHEPDDDVRAAAGPPVALLEHPVGLADAGRHAEVQPQPPARRSPPRSGTAPAARPATAGRRGRRAPRRSSQEPVQVEVELEDVDAGLAEEAEQPALGVAGDGRLDVGDGDAAGRGDAGDLVRRRPRG